MVKGWKRESARHSLARKGIETGRKQKYEYKLLTTVEGEEINNPREKRLIKNWLKKLPKEHYQHLEIEVVKDIESMPNERRGFFNISTKKILLLSDTLDQDVLYHEIGHKVYDKYYGSFKGYEGMPIPETEDFAEQYASYYQNELSPEDKKIMEQIYKKVNWRGAR